MHSYSKHRYSELFFLKIFCLRFYCSFSLSKKKSNYLAWGSLELFQSRWEGKKHKFQSNFILELCLIDAEAARKQICAFPSWWLDDSARFHWLGECREFCRLASLQFHRESGREKNPNPKQAEAKMVWWCCPWRWPYFNLRRWQNRHQKGFRKKS